MVAGHLQEKNDFYYIVLSYKDAAGKRKTKWEATGLSVKRNKKKAEALLLERRRNFRVSTAPAEIRLDDDILFSDFMLKWLEVTKSTVQITTYASYQGMVERVIVPYFRKRGIKLVDLKATDLQDFYNKQLERVKANSVIHYHANIHKALKYAVKIDLIPTNPADKVERPKKNAFKGSYYSAEEIHALTEVAEGTKLEIPVLLASFYGLRRSEVLGLKWDAIDFEANTLEVKHIVTQASIDGKKVLVQADRAKTKSSLRTLPLVPPIRDRLLMLKGQQDTYRRLCGNSYNREYLGYLCVDEIGNIIRPNYVSEQFPKLLEKNGLRPIRFHDLRHSCASLLLANGVPMKQIQEWLGHSDFSTTANIYAHLDYASKLSSAQAMMEGLGYVSLIKQHGQARLLEEVYKACREELAKPKEERRNCVKAIYEGLTEAEISREITRLVTPHDAPCPVEVIFQTIENLHESIEGPCGDWYFTGDYPTPGGYTTVNVAYMRWFEGKGGRAYDLPL